MGLFDTVYWKCPHCGDLLDTQTKPTEVNGEMNEYDAPDAPKTVLQRACYFEEECGCGVRSRITTSNHDQNEFIIQAIFNIPLDNNKRWKLVEDGQIES